jgi:hypothetical protein
MIEVAAQECYEEVGLNIESSRLRYHTTRQMVSTMSCHRASVFSAQLTPSEVMQIETDCGQARGVPPYERPISASRRSASASCELHDHLPLDRSWFSLISRSLERFHCLRLFTAAANSQVHIAS